MPLHPGGRSRTLRAHPWVPTGATVGVALLASLCAPESVAGDLTREDVVRLALAEHPAAVASALRADAAGSAVTGAGAYAPLMVEAGMAPGMIVMGRPGVQASVGWELPLWGMRGLARSVAGREADMAAAADRMTRAELAAWASIAVDDWLLAVERLDVLEHHAATMSTVRDVVARRVAAGLAPAGAEAMARMALLDLEEERLGALRDLADAESAITALAGVSASELSVDIERLDGAAVDGTYGSAPSVEMAKAELAMRGDMTEMARREGRPMIAPMVSLNAMWPEPMDWAMVGVEVGIPIDTGALRARRDAAAQEQRASAATVDAAQRDVDRTRAEAVAMLRMAEAMEALMRDQGEPLAVERARLARTAWEGDLAPVSEWLDAERDLFEMRWRIAEARAERSRSLAMIAMIDGRTVGASEETP